MLQHNAIAVTAEEKIQNYPAIPGVEKKIFYYLVTAIQHIKIISSFYEPS